MAERDAVAAMKRLSELNGLATNDTRCADCGGALIWVRAEERWGHDFPEPQVPHPPVLPGYPCDHTWVRPDDGPDYCVWCHTPRPE